MTVLVGRGIGMDYRDGAHRRTVLDAIDIDIEAGELAVAQGPSGSGKTTLLRILAGLLRPTSGVVAIMDLALQRQSAADLARVRRDHVGLVAQDIGLLADESVWVNVTLPLTIARPRPRRQDLREAFDKALGRAELHLKPRTRVSTLSRGEQQRVAVARALINDPTIVIADEPTASLDRATGGQLVNSLRNEADRGAAVLLTTHDAAVAAACDTRYRISEGHLLRRE